MKTLIKNYDSRQRNLAKSLLKSAVVNVGIQALGKNLNKDNFWQTLLVGAAGGFGDYFGGNVAMGAVLGCGNALINKSNFLGTTAKYAALSFAADGVLKIAEAKAEELPEKERWKTIDSFELPNGNLPLRRQSKDYVGCTHATLISIAKYLGYETSSLEKEERGLTENDGADFYQLAKSKGFNVMPIENDAYKIGLKLRENCPAAITYTPFSEVKPHTAGINKIEYQENIKNPNRTRFIITIMNPQYGNYCVLSDSEFINGRVRFIKQ